MLRYLTVVGVLLFSGCVSQDIDGDGVVTLMHAEADQGSFIEEASAGSAVVLASFGGNGLQCLKLAYDVYHKASPYSSSTSTDKAASYCKKAARVSRPGQCLKLAYDVYHNASPYSSASTSVDKAASYCENDYMASDRGQCLKLAYDVFHKASPYSSASTSVDKAASYCKKAARASRPGQCLKLAYDVYHNASPYSSASTSVDKAASYCERPARVANPAACLKERYTFLHRTNSASTSVTNAAEACSTWDHQSWEFSGTIVSQTRAFMILSMFSASCIMGIILYVRRFRRSPSTSLVPLLA